MDNLLQLRSLKLLYKLATIFYWALLTERVVNFANCWQPYLSSPQTEFPHAETEHLNPSPGWEDWNTLDDNQQSLTPRQQIINLFHSTWGGTFKNKWYGISTVQNPLDVWITQEIMFETKPDVVVECGTYHGGSAILWATILKNIVPDARIITIDIKDVRDPAAKVHPLTVESVDFLLGSSTDPKIVAEVKRCVKGKKVLLILDSLHTRDHVLDELNSYWDIVTGPGKAVKDFLAINKNFKIDQTRERFGLTNNRNGFLKRVQ